MKGSIRESVLEPLPGPGWRAQFRLPAADALTAELHLSDELPLPSVLDGWVAAFLPRVLRVGGRFRIAGPMSRTALRNLTELAEAWHSWRPAEFLPLTLEPEAVIDQKTSSHTAPACVAWSGSLRSLHVVARQRLGLVPTPYAVSGVVRVWGLHPDEVGCDPEPALASARHAFGELGLSLTVVQVRTVGDGGVDRRLGDLPWVAAALHRVGARFPIGFHARRWLWATQCNYPRPEPALPDLWSGDAGMIRADDGAVSPVHMLRELSAFPSLLPLISNCERRPRHVQPCGRCVGCRWLGLAQAAAGSAPVPGPWSMIRLPRLDARGFAEAEYAHREWMGPPAWARTTLAARLALHRRRQRLRSTLRWLGSAAGARASWPR